MVLLVWLCGGVVPYLGSGVEPWLCDGVEPWWCGAVEVWYHGGVHPWLCNCVPWCGRSILSNSLVPRNHGYCYSFLCRPVKNAP